MHSDLFLGLFFLILFWLLLMTRDLLTMSFKIFFFFDILLLVLDPASHSCGLDYFSLLALPYICLLPS